MYHIFNSSHQLTYIQHVVIDKVLARIIIVSSLHAPRPEAFNFKRYDGH